MVLDLVLLLAGFVVLIKGADFVVTGASSIAQRFRISPLVIGLTIVAFGTSAPELAVNIINSVQGDRNDAIIGNIIGSNIFNLFMILGVTGLIYPFVVKKNSIKYEIPMSLLAGVIMLFLLNDTFLHPNADNLLSRWDSLILLLCFLFFMFYIFRSMKNKTAYDGEPIKIYSGGISALLMIGGILMLVGGGYLVTEGAVAIANAFGLSQRLIGLTILSVGTSLPELATAVMAAYKKNADIAIGNVLGSNILNIFLILGINGMISPVAYNDTVMNTDILVLCGGTVWLLISMFTLRQNRLDRWEAMIFIMLYMAYTGYLILRN